MDYLTFDLGGSYIKSAIISDSGLIFNKKIHKTPNTYEELLDYINNVFINSDSVFNYIGLSCPGIYSQHENIICGSSAIDYIVGKDIVNDLNKLNTQLYSIIENDGNAAILGEYWKGNAIGSKNAIILVVGSAIGGGAIHNGQLLRGFNNGASEFGYMMLDNNVEQKKYHSLGGKIGMNGLINQINHFGYDFDNGKELFNKVTEDKILLDLVKKELIYLALGIINLQYIIDPEVILLGGAVSRNPIFINLIKENIQEILSIRKNYKIIPNVKASKYGNDANLLGIAYKIITSNENSN